MDEERKPLCHPEMRNSKCFLAIFENSFIVDEDDKEDEVDKAYQFFKACVKQKHKYRLLDYRKDYNCMHVSDGKSILRVPIPKDTKRPVNRKVLFETFRLMPNKVSDIVKKWKKYYYAYGYKLLTEGKFGVGYEEISIDEFISLMEKIDTGNRDLLYRYKPKKTFDSGWELPNTSNQLQLDIAKSIGQRFIDLYNSINESSNHS